MRKKDKNRRGPGRKGFRFYKKRPCLFCKEKTIPDYKQADVLSKYLTDRGKIVTSSRSGVCSKHQRLLSTQIKRARFLGLLPFAAQL
ncbi:30S ribosomal protein S18 [Patescibacteria group bacterium]